MKYSIAQYLHSVVGSLDWKSQIKRDFDIVVSGEYNPLILFKIYKILDLIPEGVLKFCKVKNIEIKDLGPNKAYYPNHGYYTKNLIVLNHDIFCNPDTPDDFVFGEYFMSRPVQTLLHEFGHALDEECGQLSVQKDWLSLSGWSKIPKKGLKRLCISEKGSPTVLGEWYYNPASGFTRFYARRNPWDDWADSFCFYMARMYDKLPDSKQKYFQEKIRNFL